MERMKMHLRKYLRFFQGGKCVYAPKAYMKNLILNGIGIISDILLIIFVYKLRMNVSDAKAHPWQYDDYIYKRVW